MIGLSRGLSRKQVVLGKGGAPTATVFTCKPCIFPSNLDILVKHHREATQIHVSVIANLESMLGSCQSHWTRHRQLRVGITEWSQEERTSRETNAVVDKA